MGDVIITTYGPLGVILVVLAVAFKQLQGQLTTSQEHRVTDAQGTTGTILELVEQHNEGTRELAVALNANTEALRANNEAILALERRFNSPPTAAPPFRGG